MTFDGQAGAPRSTRSDFTELAPGARVAEFRIVRLLGRGGMGAVYLARDTKLGRKVALKVVLPDRFGEKEAVDRFLFEARATAKFSHPNIVGIYSVGEAQGAPYVALEYVEGETLRARLKEERPSPMEALRIGHAIAEALTEAHKSRIMHRDLKPENVLLARDGRVRVADFGIAKVLEEKGEATGASDGGFGATTSSADGGERGLPSTSSDGGHTTAFDTSGTGMRGSPLYMAPEQWKGTTREATDVWALGMILYEMLAGKRPYSDSTPSHQLALRVCSNEPVPKLETEPPLRDDVVGLVGRCLAKSPMDRPPAREVAAALAKLVVDVRPRSDEEHDPFRGLSAFHERHAEDFFGRDAEIAAFLERMRERAVLPIVGPSGSGKSSFVQAGVIPRLREQARWVVVALRPGDRPFRTLATRLRRAPTAVAVTLKTISGGTLSGEPVSSQRTSGAYEADDVLADRLEATPSLLGVRLRELAESERSKVLLFVDHIEELYTHVEDDAERRAFMEALAGAADDPQDPVRAVFTVRDDFLGRIAFAGHARDVLQELTILRAPEADALEKILRKPVENAGYVYEDTEMVSEMIASVRGEPAPLPLLEFAATALWDKRDRGRRMLLRAAFETMGGVVGALATHAESVLESLDPTRLSLAKAILLRLVTPQGQRRSLPRARATEGLDGHADDVLKRLVESRLVSVRRARGGAAGDADVELVHEALVGAWQRLARWIEESQEDRALVSEIAQAAELWERRGARDDDAWTGGALRDAVRVLERSGELLPARARAFIDAGRRKQRRALRRRRAVLGAVVAVPLLAAAGSTVAALKIAEQRREANDARALAEREASRAESGRARAEVESAGAALARGDLYAARAELRAALETEDSPAARALFWQTRADPRAWGKDVGAPVFGMAWTPDGKTLLLGRGDGAVQLLDAVSLSGPLMRGPDAAAIGSISLSADGRTLASWSADGAVQIWDVAARSARLLPARAGPAYTVSTLALSPDGARVALPKGNDVEVWRTNGGTLEATLHGNTGRVEGVAFSPDGRRVASASLDHTVRLFDSVDPAKTVAIDGLPGGVRAVAFSADGARVAAGCIDGAVRVWDAGSLALQRTLLGHGGIPAWVAFSPDGRHLASGSADRTSRLWDLETGEGRVLDGSGRTHALPVVFSPDGQLVVTSFPYDDELRAERVLVPSAAPRAPISPSGGVGGTSFDASGKLLASASVDGAVRVWDVATAYPRVVYRGPARSWAVAFSPTEDGLLAYATNDGGIVLHDAREAAPAGVVDSKKLAGHSVEVRYLAFSDDGRALASQSFDGVVRLWDTKTLRERKLPREIDGLHNPGGVAIGHDGRLLALSADDGFVSLWHTDGDPRPSRVASPLATSTQLLFGHGDTLVGMSGVEGVAVLDLEAKTSRVFDRESNRWTAFSADGAKIGGSCNDGRARIWDVATGAMLPLEGHRSGTEINFFAFSRDGALAATSGDDWTVRVWDASTGHPVWRAPFARRTAPVALTHRGWESLDGSGRGVPDAGAKWRAALEASARDADESEDGSHVCLRTWEGQIEMWRLADDARAFRADATGPGAVVATREGCAAIVGGEGRAYDASGAVVLAHGGATALAEGGGKIFVAAERTLYVHAPRGEPIAMLPIDAAATSVSLLRGAIALGYQDGSVAVVPEAGGAPAALAADRVLATPVTAVLEGPPGTLVVAYRSGTIALVDRATGEKLYDTRVHGAVAHLSTSEGRLYAVSDLGDALVLDLRALYLSRCELLREVWAEVPALWADGRPLPAPPPSDHPCAAPR